MSRCKRVGQLGVWLAIGVVAILALGIGAWRFSSGEHHAKGRSERSFDVEVDYDKFRQIMVRKNATSAIISHSGMKLLDEQIEGLDVDTSKDDRPILNALRGKSRAELSAVKQIVVQMNDPELDADQLVLSQVSEIQADEMTVRTHAKAPTGKLEGYENSFSARRDENTTHVTVTVDMTVRVRIPKFFTARADQRVQQAAENATREQKAAIQDFVSTYASQRFILPELGNK